MHWFAQIGGADSSVPPPGKKKIAKSLSNNWTVILPHLISARPLKAMEALALAQRLPCSIR